jgi:hypothetical protein
MTEAAEIISLINSDGWNNLLHPYLKEAIEESKEALVSVPDGMQDENELKERDRNLRAIINVYRALLARVEEWVDDVNETKEKKEDETNG